MNILDLQKGTAHARYFPVSKEEVRRHRVARDIWVVALVLGLGTVTMLVSKSGTQSYDATSGWIYPVIRDYGRAWPLPHAAVQPQKGRTYKAILDLTQPPPSPGEVLDGLAHAARTLNVFAADGLPATNLKVVAVFHGSAGYAAMSNDVYRAKFGVDNPNLKIIRQLKEAGVRLLLCGQTLHDLNFSEHDMLPDLELATSAAIVLVSYENDGYALMSF